MLANADTSEQAILNDATLTWSATGTGKADVNNEEAWTLLPNKQLLTVDARNGTNSELYVPASGKWHSAGSTIVELSPGLNIGQDAPAFLELSCRGDLPLPQSQLPVLSLYGNCSRIVRIEEQCPQRPTEFAFVEEGRLLVWSQ